MSTTTDFEPLLARCGTHLGWHPKCNWPVPVAHQKRDLCPFLPDPHAKEYCNFNSTRFNNMHAFSLREQCSERKAVLGFNPPAFLSCLRGSVLVISGDSLSRYHFFALACALHRRFPSTRPVEKALDNACGGPDSQPAAFVPEFNVTVIFCPGSLGLELSQENKKLLASLRSTNSSTSHPAAFVEQPGTELTTREVSALLEQDHYQPLTRCASSRDKFCGLRASTDHGGARQARANCSAYAGFSRTLCLCSTAGRRCVLLMNVGHRVPSSVVHEVGVARMQRTYDDLMLRFSNLYVIWRSFAPRHYLGGEWNEGGLCSGARQSGLHSGALNARDEAQLLSQRWHAGNYSQHMLRRAVEGEGLPERYGVARRVGFMDVTELMWQRADAHLEQEEERYRKPPKPGDGVAADCSHYCIGAAVQAWNVMLEHSLCDSDSQFDFAPSGCPSMDACPRGVRAALRHSVASPLDRRGPAFCDTESLTEWRGVEALRRAGN